MPHRLDYRAHTQFVAPAEPHSEVWRLVFGLLLVVVALAVLGPLFSGTVLALAIGAGSEVATLGLEAGATPFAVLLGLFSYGMVIPAVFGVIWILHDRPVWTLFGPLRSLVGQFTIVVVALVLINGVIALLPPWGYGFDLVENVAFNMWLALLPVSMLAILVQTSAEEVLFRGYIQQQLGARFQSPLIWLIVPSILFGALHYAPATQGENAPYIALWAVLFAMAAADLTARSGTLGPAIALHFVNNLLALLYLSLPDGWHGIALYVTPFSGDDVETIRVWLWVDLGFLLVSWLAARLAIRR